MTTISLEPGITAVKPPAVLTHRRPIKGIVALVGLIVVAGFLVILSLNMAVAQGAFTVALLEEEAAALSEREQALLRQVAQLESPASLATKAKALGMQPAPGGSFLRLADGTMVGPGVPKKLQKPAGGRDKP